jgi:hypothetical protein
MADKNILLIEPGYKNKYPPLGLMKLAQYHGSEGKQDNVRFIKGEDKSVLGVCWDRIYVTTLFSFEWKRISDSIDFAVKIADGHLHKIFVGGIAASLMHESFLAEKRWRGIRFISGLLKESPAVSLQLDPFVEELYSEDRSGTPIEDLIPDYSILAQTGYQYPVSDAYFAYASRGCIRKCSFCGVPKLEGDLYETPSLTAVVDGIRTRYGEKKNLILMDNNVVASPRFREIIAEIRDLGFTPEAKLKRGKVSGQRRVDFNQGVDARILCKDIMFLKQLSTICLKPLRIAFDHIGVRKPYETAIRYAKEVGLHDLSNYMLYNFHDSPSDLYLRMRLNIDLNEELGIRIFSFPMRYQPTDMKDRSYIGEKWHRYYLRSMQIILQATHGIVSGAPEYFKRAFGSSVDEFQRLLIRPHHFIFNRDWYEEDQGKEEFERYRELSQQLSDIDRQELLHHLSGYTPSRYNAISKTIVNSKVAQVFVFYKPLSNEVEADIWRMQRLRKRTFNQVSTIPEDELVEDAGLELEPTLRR